MRRAMAPFRYSVCCGPGTLPTVQVAMRIPRFPSPSVVISHPPIAPEVSGTFRARSVDCLFVIVGCTTQLDAVLDFADAMVFAMALANVTCMYLLAPVVKRELDRYWSQIMGTAPDGG